MKNNRQALADLTRQMFTAIACWWRCLWDWVWEWEEDANDD